MIIGGTSNSHTKEVAGDIRDALLSQSASPDGPAHYRLKEEQYTLLCAAYKKWSDHGGVWSAAAPAVRTSDLELEVNRPIDLLDEQVHANQLKHVLRGCLTRPPEYQNVRSDGSRVEGCNRAWNGIMKSHPCGLEVFLALGHDFVLRRNIRIVMKGPIENCSEFVKSTFGSHYVGLVDYVAKQWNVLFAKVKGKTRRGIGEGEYCKWPELRDVQSGETFGLVPSFNMVTFGGRIKFKQEGDQKNEEADGSDTLTETLEIHEGSAIQRILKRLNIDPNLCFVPEKPSGILPGDPQDPSAAEQILAILAPNGTAPELNVRENVENKVSPHEYSVV